MGFFDNIIEYIMDGTISRGSFKWYLLTGNLFEAIRHADDNNIEIIPQLVQWLWAKAPISSYGSIDIVVSWAKAGGMIGKFGEAHTAAWESTVRE